MEQTAAFASPPPTRRDQLDFELLYLLGKEPGLSQRELADRLGISLGKVNYCLKGLFALGAIKFGNFRQSPNKMRYVYVLTPLGIARKAALTHIFLKRKIEEYERLKMQIEALEDDLSQSSSQ